MGLQEFRTRLQTDKQLQIIVGAVALVVVVGVVAFLMMGRSSSAPADAGAVVPDPAMGVMPPMPTTPAGAPGTDPTGGVPAAPAAPVDPSAMQPTAPASGTPPTADGASPAPAQNTGGPTSMRKGPPTMPYRVDPFEVSDSGGAKIAKILGIGELPRVVPPVLQSRKRRGGGVLPAAPPQLPTVRRRVSGIMLNGMVAAIIEEEGQQPRVVQPGDKYYREGGTEVRVEKIEANAVTLREGKVSVRVPLKGSDVATADASGTMNNMTPGMPGMPGMAPMPEAGVAPGGFPGMRRTPASSGQIMTPPMAMPMP